MLADTPTRSPGLGSPGPGVLAQGTFLARVIDFIVEHLPSWRDNPDRPQVQNEDELTDQLSTYLNSAARFSALDYVQFRTEVPDSVNKRRSLDLAVQPCGQPLIVEGRRYTLFDVLLPIECKRLPTPGGHGRDEREYVSSGVSAGGIQRFKLGAHGSNHPLGVMIGYIQDDQPAYWLGAINHWLLEAGETNVFWAGEQLVAESTTGSVQRLRSTHRRSARGTSIELLHLWISCGVAGPALATARGSTSASATSKVDAADSQLLLTAPVAPKRRRRR